jgi:hypothetical protein
MDVANLTLGPEFLKEVQNRYYFREEEDVEMRLEKLQLLVTSCVDAFQKIMWLKWWNAKCLVQEHLRF